jgi:predicted AAA+ superfamily ATPase
MIVRQTYLEKLKLMRDKKIIKVITGVRRSGKSTLLEMYRDFLVSSGVHPSCCQYINFEDLRWESLKDYHALYNHILENLSPNEKNYIFLDEIQIVPEFQKAINSLFLRDDVDIYITGSNAYLLSGELSSLLSGRYIELSILPLSFKEYWELVGGDKKTAFNKYYLNGGFPYAATIDNKEVRLEYFRGIFNTVLLKDIVERKRISDVKLLEDVIRFLFDNIGNIVSTKKIADTLNSNGRRTTSGTIDNYIRH